MNEYRSYKQHEAKIFNYRFIKYKFNKLSINYNKISNIDSILPILG